MILPRTGTLEHRPRRRLRQKEHRLEVEIHHRIPVIFGEIERFVAADDAGVVHQDVEPAALRHRFA